MTSASARLRKLLLDPEFLIIPGVVDPWAARIAERSGVMALLATGAGIANTKFGLPDIGLMGRAEMSEAVQHIAGSVGIPVIADGDNGYGNALSVVHTVRHLEASGAAGVMIEDQVVPKKCGHFDNKQVVSVHEMVEKIAAFREAREDEDLVLIARTDAIEVEGFEAAIERGQIYAAAGADVIFIEAPRDLSELSQVPALVPVPTIANIVEGGKTPEVGREELQDMGYSGAFFANVAMRVAGQAMGEAFQILCKEGSTRSLRGRMLGWDDRQAIAGLTEWSALESKVVSAALQMQGDVNAR